MSLHSRPLCTEVEILSKVRCDLAGLFMSNIKTYYSYIYQDIHSSLLDRHNVAP